MSFVIFWVLFKKKVSIKYFGFFFTIFLLVFYYLYRIQNVLQYIGKKTSRNKLKIFFYKILDTFKILLLYFCSQIITIKVISLK